MLAAGIRETSRGQTWSENCREWVYFDCVLDLPSLRKRFSLSEVVQDHDHLSRPARSRETIAAGRT